MGTDTRYNVQCPEARLFAPARPVERVPRVVGRLRDEHDMGVLPGPALESLGGIDRDLVPVYDALVGQQPSAGNVRQRMDVWREISC